MDLPKLFTMLLCGLCIWISLNPPTTVDYDTLELAPCDLSLGTNSDAIEYNYFLKSCVSFFFLSSVFNCEKEISRQQPYWLVWAALSLLGTGFRFSSMQELGKYFTFRLTHFQDHKLITTGPYSIFRHPSYVGLLLALVGYVALSEAPLAISTWFIVLVSILVLLRIWNEEKFLCEQFGSEYTEYQKGGIPIYWCEA